MIKVNRANIRGMVDLYKSVQREPRPGAEHPVRHVLAATARDFDGPLRQVRRASGLLKVARPLQGQYGRGLRSGNAFGGCHGNGEGLSAAEPSQAIMLGWAAGSEPSPHCGKSSVRRIMAGGSQGRDENRVSSGLYHSHDPQRRTSGSTRNGRHALSRAPVALGSLPPWVTPPKDARPSFTANLDMMVDEIKSYRQGGRELHRQRRHQRPWLQLGSPQNDGDAHEVHIVVAGGLWTQPRYPPDIPMKSEDQIAEDSSATRSLNGGERSGKSARR